MMDNTKKIILHSSDGKDEISLSFLYQIEVSEEQYFCFSSAIRSKSHSRFEPIKEVIDTEDFDCTIHQLQISKKNLELLTEKLERWIVTYEEFSVDLIRMGEQSLQFTISKDSDLICTAYKPAILFSYASYKIAFDHRFVVDLTCINLFLTQLRQLFLL